MRRPEKVEKEEGSESKEVRGRLTEKEKYTQT